MPRLTRPREARGDRPVLLDLFCGAGGAARGYQLAGFHVTGVDINPQPNYCGDQFIQSDATTFPLEGFDAYHGSPPCQDHSGLRHPLAGSHGTAWMLAATRERFRALHSPWVLENVLGSGLAEQDDLLGTRGLLLCGAMFGLPLYRHRLFETSFPVAPPHHPRHLIPASKAGHWKPGTIISVAGNCAPIELARKAMGDVDWMTRDELAESIPPAFAEHIGDALLEHLAECAA
jgi:DNA (cytosine-5)-methyltransferase 1